MGRRLCRRKRRKRRAEKKLVGVSAVGGITRVCGALRRPRIKTTWAAAAAFSLVPNFIMAAGGRLFEWGDYAVFGLMLAVSAAIGLYHGLRRGSSGSAAEFLTGGGQLGTVPVALSMLARYKIYFAPSCKNLL